MSSYIQAPLAREVRRKNAKYLSKSQDPHHGSLVPTPPKSQCDRSSVQKASRSRVRHGPKIVQRDGEKSVSWISSERGQVQGADVRIREKLRSSNTSFSRLPSNVKRQPRSVCKAPPRSEKDAPMFPSIPSAPCESKGLPSSRASARKSSAASHKRNPPQKEWSNAQASRSQSGSHLPTHRKVDEGDARMQVLHLENQVMKAVKGREDSLERLFICAEKVDDTAKSSGGWLSKNDPIVKLFYRLVSTLRDKTVVAVEAICAFQRLTSASSPFTYNGHSYLHKMGPDLAFLDEVEYVRHRLREHSVVKDPFLRLLTPNGIPFDEVTPADLQRGGRINTMALRIRMAAKVMEQDAQRNPVKEADKQSLYIGSKAERHSHSKSARTTKIPGQSLYTIVDSAARTIQSVFRGFLARRSAKGSQGEATEEQWGVRGWSTGDELKSWSEANSENDEVDAVLDAVLDSLEPAHADAFPPLTFTVQGWQSQSPLVFSAPRCHTAPRRPQQGSTEADEVDYILDVIIDSLQGRMEGYYKKGTFTVSGWEIDHHFM